MDTHFKTITHAKCILAGEHSVQNKYSLIAKSVPFFQLCLQYHDNKKPLHLELDGHCSLSNENLLMYFYALIKKSLALVHKENTAVTGTFIVNTNIPIAAGLGFSAAICAALTEWLIWKKWLNSADKFNAARQLEHMFHGESSGADIAACLSTDIIIFKLPTNVATIKPAWQPNMYISTTNRTTITADSVLKVQQFREAQPELSSKIDNKMEEATMLIIEGLTNNNSNSLHCLMNAFNQASECFAAWQLIPQEVQQEIAFLIQQGAIAAKPTGAGNGGSVISLWDAPPPANLGNKLISVF